MITTAVGHFIAIIVSFFTAILLFAGVVTALFAVLCFVAYMKLDVWKRGGDDPW